MAKRTTVKPDPGLTWQLQNDVEACARWLEQNEQAFTQALTDPDTRQELKRLVGDLWSLCEVIVTDSRKAAAATNTPNPGGK